MVYITAAEVQESVRGANRLYGPDGILQGRADTSSSHPYLDAQIAAAAIKADGFLSEAGYEIPLATPDQLFKSAVIGLLVGLVTIDMDNKQQWMRDMEDAGLAYFQQMIAGSITPTSAEEDPDAAADSVISAVAPYEDPIFDGPYSGARSVFDDLGGSPYRRGRW